MRVPVRLVAPALALVLIAGVGAVLLHDDATPYDAEQALEEFRAAPSASAVASARPSVEATNAAAAVASITARPVPRRSGSAGVAAAPSRRPSAAASAQEPQPGVYTYATSGHEEVDALGGSRHDYPAETTVTYVRTGCGRTNKWQPLKERVSSDDICRAAGGAELRRSVQRRSFFGQTEEQVLVCEPGFVLIPTGARPGSTSRGTCRSDDTVVALTSRFVGIERMQVGGRGVEVFHLRTTVRLTGSTRGSSEREGWFTPSGLLVQVRATTDSVRDTSAGAVRYTETYELRLQSLDPKR